MHGRPIKAVWTGDFKILIINGVQGLSPDGRRPVIRGLALDDRERMCFLEITDNGKGITLTSG